MRYVQHQSNDSRSVPGESFFSRRLFLAKRRRRSSYGSSWTLIDDQQKS